MQSHLLAALLLALGTIGSASANVDCAAIEKRASQDGALIPGYQSGYDVIGQGSLQLHSAPNSACPLQGLFLMPGDKVNASKDYLGYTFVLFINPKTNVDAMGWVDSSRLKSNGKGIAPKR